MTLAILPARGGSRRILRKNLVAVNGVPLLAWAIRIVRESGAFERVVVSTDDPDIAELTEAWGAEVPFVRDPALADDHASTTDVLVDAVTRLGGDALSRPFACVYPTALLACPLRLAEAVRWMNEDPRLDSVITVTPFPVSPQRAWRISAEGNVVPHDPAAMAMRTQDLEPAWWDAGQWYLFRPAALLATRDLLGSRCRPMIQPPMESEDIDTPEDLALAVWKHSRLARWQRPGADVLVRADCGPGVGTGHVMRCLALCEVLRERGLAVTMVLTHPTTELIERVEATGVRALTLPASARGDWHADAAWCLQQAPAPGQMLRWVVVDHYRLDARWHAAMRSTGARLLAVDDLGDRPLAIDVLLNQVPLPRVHQESETRCVGSTRFLFGPSWTLLRREFREVAAARSNRQLATRPKVLLFFGGEDAQGLTLVALHTLSTLLDAFSPIVLVGHSHATLGALVARCAHLGVPCHVAHPSPAVLLGEVDAVVSTCGMFALEVWACGLPLVLVPVSAIQSEVADCLAADPRVLQRTAEVLGDPAGLAQALGAVLAADSTTSTPATFDAAMRVVDLMFNEEPDS